MTICWFYIELTYNWILIDSLFKWISVTFRELSTFWFWNQLEHCVIFSCRIAVLLKEISKASSIAFLLWHTTHYYINTNEIPGELSHENMISSYVKITCYFQVWKISPLLWLHNKSRLSQDKTVSVKWLGISLVFIWLIEHYMAAWRYEISLLV